MNQNFDSVRYQCVFDELMANDVPFHLAEKAAYALARNDSDRSEQDKRDAVREAMKYHRARRTDKE